jgi:hypothetical protein
LTDFSTTSQEGFSSLVTDRQFIARTWEKILTTLKKVCSKASSIQRRFDIDAFDRTKEILADFL